MAETTKKTADELEADRKAEVDRKLRMITFAAKSNPADRAELLDAVLVRHGNTNKGFRMTEQEWTEFQTELTTKNKKYSGFVDSLKADYDIVKKNKTYTPKEGSGEPRGGYIGSAVEAEGKEFKEGYDKFYESLCGEYDEKGDVIPGKEGIVDKLVAAGFQPLLYFKNMNKRKSAEVEAPATETV